MNAFRLMLIGTVAALATACSSTPSKPPAQQISNPVTNVAGNWTLSVNTPMGVLDFTMSVVQNGRNISAKITDNKGTYDYNGSVSGNEVKLGHDSQGVPGMRIEYTGTVAADAMNGKAVFGTYGEGAFTAKRLK